MSYQSPDNSDDIIDSRSIIERIEALQSSIDDCDPLDLEDLPDEDEVEELRILKELAEEGEGYGDWTDGATLIRDSYFEDFARSEAEELGLIPDDASWPLTCIDWEQAATELQSDYTSIEFDGVTYWMSDS